MPDPTRQEFIEYVAQWVIDTNTRLTDVAPFLEMDLYSGVCDIVEAHICEAKADATR